MDDDVIPTSEFAVMLLGQNLLASEFACSCGASCTFGIASTFVGLSDGIAKFGFLALAAAMVTVGGVWLSAMLAINPDAVYRMAMRKLNTSAPALGVMAALLTGTELRAYVMSGGGPRINLGPRLSNKRCFIIFPISGSERKVPVSIEVKKRRGQYDFKLLAVDIPTAGADHRGHLVGDEQEYQVDGGLISVLRDPIVKAMAAQKEFEDHDEKEELEDIQRQWEEEQVLERDRIERLERDAAAAEQAEEEASEIELQMSLEEAERLREEPKKALVNFKLLILLSSCGAPEARLQHILLREINE